MAEIRGLQRTLASEDRPGLLVSNSNPLAIRTRVKLADNRAYLITSNVTGKPVSASFKWVDPPAQVTVHAEGRALPVNEASFSDTFKPYEAHVYVIETRRRP
jgi:hypothetical protein